jgi:acyl carrier protein
MAGSGNNKSGEDKMSDNKMDAVETAVADIISRVLNVKLDNQDAKWDDLNLDSLARLEIMSLLEEEFSLELTEDILSQFTSISRIARIIRQTPSGVAYETQ